MIKSVLHGRPTVLVVLPRAGLGNRLLVWANAVVFAHLNGLPIHTVGWHQIRLGPWLRGERTKRYYGGYFMPDAGLIARLTDLPRYRLTSNARNLVNPPVERMSAQALAHTRWIVFDALPHWSDYFRDLKGHRALVREKLYAQVHPTVRRQLAACTRPSIGVHARLGDFRALKPGEDFAKVGAVRTPQSYFVDAIKKLREVRGPQTPVTVFSDGRRDELHELLSLPGTELAPPRNDLVDMLLLARSDVIVTSAGSSFSYWAGFLSDAQLILHPDHIHGSIRPLDDSLYEGPVSDLCGQTAVTGGDELGPCG